MQFCLLVFSELEYNPSLREVERWPFLRVLVDGVGVEARGITKHYKPETLYTTRTIKGQQIFTIFRTVQDFSQVVEITSCLYLRGRAAFPEARDPTTL